MFSVLQTLTQCWLCTGFWKSRPASKALIHSFRKCLLNVAVCQGRHQGFEDKGKMGKDPAIKKPLVQRRLTCK